MTRAYISNISPGWTRERQLAALGDHADPLYEDQLSKAALARLRKRDKRVPVPGLIERDRRMLRPTARKAGETIYVASLVCLAVDWEDLALVLRAASARRATIHAMDTGHEIPPSDAADQWAQAMEDFSMGRGRSRTEPGRQLGRVVAAEAKKADTLRRIALIRDRWPDPAWSTKDLLAEAGPRPGSPMAYQLAASHLGKRPKVIAAHRRHMEQKERIKDATPEE